MMTTIVQNFPEPFFFLPYSVLIWNCFLKISMTSLLNIPDAPMAAISARNSTYDGVSV